MAQRNTGEFIDFNQVRQSQPTSLGINVTQSQYFCHHPFVNQRLKNYEEKDIASLSTGSNHTQI